MINDYKYDLPKDKLEEYKSTGGSVCPLCGGKETGTVDDNDIYRQVIECTSCEASFMEVTEVARVLLDTPYVIPLSDAKDMLMHEMGQMLFLIWATFESAGIHHTDLTGLKNIVDDVRTGTLDRLLDNISEVYARLGKERGIAEDAQTVREIWEYVAKSRRDDLMGFD